MCNLSSFVQPGVHRASFLSLSTWVPGEGLTHYWPLAFGGCVHLSPESLKDHFFCWLLVSPFSDFHFVGGVKPVYPEDSFEEGKWLGFLRYCSLVLQSQFHRAGAA